MNLAKADKFVEPGFLMHWGEDMNVVAGDGGALCQRPSLPYTLSLVLSLFNIYSHAHLCTIDPFRTEFLLQQARWWWEQLARPTASHEHPQAAGPGAAAAYLVPASHVHPVDVA